mmetsp:Transcript_13431/g.49950  ORF Transcript_13431/g.49950 Transcript_13431/m.49950 type:complete len:218 (+) Transcript_13431:2335-2988(+)
MPLRTFDFGTRSTIASSAEVDRRWLASPPAPDGIERIRSLWLWLRTKSGAKGSRVLPENRLLLRRLFRNAAVMMSTCSPTPDPKPKSSPSLSRVEKDCQTSAFRSSLRYPKVVRRLVSQPTHASAGFKDESEERREDCSRCWWILVTRPRIVGARWTGASSEQSISHGMCEIASSTIRCMGTAVRRGANVTVDSSLRDRTNDGPFRPSSSGFVRDAT